MESARRTPPAVPPIIFCPRDFYLVLAYSTILLMSSFMIETIKQLNLPTGEFVVVGSGLLDALDLRTSDDVDLVVSEDLYNRLKAGGWQSENKSWGELISKSPVEAMLSWDSTDGGNNLADLIQTSVSINGINFVSPKRLLAWKRKKNRPKGQKDIELLEKYLGSESKL